MDINIQTETFFMISSVGFMLLWILTAIFLFYLIKAMHKFSKIAEHIERDVDAIGDTTKEMIEDIHDSTIFNFIFRKKKTKPKSKSKV